MRTFIFAISFLLCFFQCACGQKVKAPSNQEIIQQGYKKFLQKKWIDLNTQEEWILKTCLDKETTGGAEVPDLRYQDKEANKLADGKMLEWDSNNRKYKITQLGKDVYQTGMDFREEEMKKDPKMRSERTIKENHIQ